MNSCRLLSRLKDVHALIVLELILVGQCTLKIKLKLEFLPTCRMFLQMMGQSLLSCLVKWLR